LYDSTGKQIRNINDLTIDSLNFFNADGDLVNEVMSSLDSTKHTNSPAATEFIKNTSKYGQKKDSPISI